MAIYLNCLFHNLKDSTTLTDAPIASGVQDRMCNVVYLIIKKGLWVWFTVRVEMGCSLASNVGIH